ncbi:hypothetical protein [Georgenia sp. SUBG003]|uniref:hypothetical protein n=1 Tax=Georgenia sp. SUBG003 TaxID=1497974 RepID=UPI003AB6821B
MPASTRLPDGALDTAADQGRLMLWSAVPEEQALINGTTLSGELRGEVGDSPLVGIYVHDRSGAKIAYYEHVDAQVTSKDVRLDGSQRLSVTVTVSSRVPEGVETMPPLLTGGGNFVPVGSIRSDIHVYARPAEESSAPRLMTPAPPTCRSSMTG